MAFLNGIFNKQPATPAPVAPVQTPAAAGPATKQQQLANPGANPDNMQAPTQTTAATGPQNPLDTYANLFKPMAVDPNTPRAPTLNDPILAPLDQAAFQAQVKNANFAASIPAETMAKATSGDAAAFAEAINYATQAAFAAATQLSHGLVEHGSRTAAQRLDAGMDARVRNYQVKTHTHDNPALQHPAVAPVLGALKAQIAQQNPNLPAAEVAKQAEAWFLATSEAVQAPAKAQEAAKAEAAKPKTDFSFLLNND